jgi:hypothetical protein
VRAPPHVDELEIPLERGSTIAARSRQPYWFAVLENKPDR